MAGKSISKRRCAGVSRGRRAADDTSSPRLKLLVRPRAARKKRKTKRQKIKSKTHGAMRKEKEEEKLRQKRRKIPMRHRKESRKEHKKRRDKRFSLATEKRKRVGNLGGGRKLGATGSGSSTPSQLASTSSVYPSSGSSPPFIVPDCNPLDKETRWLTLKCIKLTLAILLCCYMFRSSRGTSPFDWIRFHFLKRGFT